MTSGFKNTKNKEELVDELGNRLIADADNLRLFMPNHVAQFKFIWCGLSFKVELALDLDKDAAV